MQRVAFVMHVKDGQEEEYIRRHRDVWPQVLTDLEKAGIGQMNIFMAGHQLFLYEEYMEPIMEDASGEIYDPKNPYPASLPEVFFWRRGA